MQYLFLTFRKYIGIYGQFLKTCFAEAASFRVNFILVAIMDLIFYATILLTVDFIFDHVGEIGPWKRVQFMFFISYMLSIDHIHMTFISEAFWEFSQKVRQGTFDFILVKPVNTIFDVFFRHIRPGTLPNSLVIWSILIYYGIENNIGLISWVMIPILMLLSLALLVSLEIIISTSTFWTIESFGINFLRMQLQQLARWPDFIYQYFARKLFTIGFPLLLIGSAPIKFMLAPAENWELIGYLILAIAISSTIAGLIWKRGLRSYESASS